MEFDSHADEILLARTSREPAAFAAFYRRHEKAILGYMRRRTGDPELAADLTAETFAAALQSAGRFRARREPASAWLFGIARNVLGRSIEKGRIEDRARRRLSMPTMTLDDVALCAIDRIDSDDAVETLLARLPDDQAHAIRARVLEDFSYEEIAAELSCSAHVIRKRVSRGLATLRVTEEQI